MKNPRALQQALLCLKAVRDGHLHPCTPMTISQSQGIPFAEVQAILERFEAAGFIRRAAGNHLCTAPAVYHATALDIVQALWTPVLPAFRLQFVPPNHQAVKRTMSAVHIAGETAREAYAAN